MSISDTILKLIEKRRINVKKNLPGDLGKFYREGGMNNILNFININNTSKVLDAGAYKGEFADEILKKFGSHLILYEPLESEFNYLKKKYQYNLQVELQNLAISNTNNYKFLTVDNNNSSLSDVKINKSIKIKCENVIDIFDKLKSIDLIKMNIEGSEYEILNEIINKNYLTKCKYYLIQFHHKNNKNLIKNKEIIENEFSKMNFKKIFNYNYVWEVWELK
mgnify:CR=1 FL=1